MKQAETGRFHYKQNKKQNKKTKKTGSWLGSNAAYHLICIIRWYEKFFLNIYAREWWFLNEFSVIWFFNIEFHKVGA